MDISAKCLSNRRSQMKVRFLALLGILILVAGFTLSAAAQAQKPAATSAKPAVAAKPAAKTYTVPRTPDGQPDLQGYWTNNSYTPLERPNGVTKEVYNEQELKAAEKRSAEREAAQTEPGTLADVHYDFTQFGLDRSQTRLKHNMRTSIIVDPPNGKMPPVTAEGQKRAAQRAAERRGQGA